MFVKMHRVMCFIVTALLILLQISCQNSVEKQFLCKNEDCTEPIGKFSVKLNYNADSSGKLSAKAKDEGIILARPKDKSTNLWKVKIQDKIGFMPNSHILEFKKWEANITVKLSIPADSVSNSDFSNTPTTSDHNKDVEKHIGANDASVTKISTDDVNSSVPNVEEIRNESVSTIVNDSSNETNNVDINKDSNSTLDPLLKTDSTTDPNTTPSNDESTNKDTTVNQSDNKSLENQLPPIVEDQFEPIGLKKESHVPDIPIKLENISVEVNESEVVNVIKESEIIAESSTNINRKLSENLTQEIDIEKDILAGEISNTSESISSHIETLNDTTSSSSDANNTPTKNNTAPDISKKTEVPNDPSVNGNAVSQDEVQVISKPSPESNISAPVDDHVVPPSDEVQVIAKPSPESNISAPVDDHAASPSAEAQVIAKPSPESNISAPVDDHAASPSAEAQVIAKPSSESNISTSVDSSLNSSATPEVFNNFGGDVKQSSDDDKPVQATSIPVETVTSEETSAEFNHEIPMRSFPNDKKPPAAPEKSDISSEEIIIATESENENVTSEEISPSLNSTHNLDSNETETENIIEGTQQHDSVTPKAIPSDVYPPPNIEGTTEIGDIKAPTSAEEIFDSNESVPLESPTIPSGSPAAEDSPLSKLSEPYKYIKSPPYPGMLPNIVTESQPSVTEKSDEVSSQEIIETEPEAISDSSSQASGPASASFNAEQKQGLNDFIHSSRAKVTEDEPEPISESETLKEKSIYETIGEFLPDFSLLAEKLNSLFDFGSTSPKEAPEIETKSEFCSAEQFCGTDHLNSHMDTPANPESENILEVPFLGVVSKEQVTYVSGILTSVFIATILLWWLMNYFNKSKKTGLLISRINQLENKLLISTREIASLQEKLVEQDCQAESKQNAADIRRITEVYEHKINQYKKRIVELDDKVLYLEKELENVSNSALEMHKLLENSLATQAQSKLALDEVETLRTLTENQEIQIDELKKEINSVVTENECLKVDNEMNKSNIKKLEKECNAQTKKNVELSEKNRSLTLLLDKELENNTVLEGNYKTEMYELRSKLEDIEMNFKRSEFQVQELQRAILDKQDTVHGSSNDVQLRIQISTLEAMNNELSGQLNEQKNARRMLEEHVGDITKELNNLKKSFENSEKERNQAVTKLQVLTQYFKDKEEQLHRELETKDKLSLERESKDQSLTQKLSLMREEISNLKTQNEELRKEVLDQEASYKVQLANAEQKTREHWFALRQAERKYKESQQEAAILRNKILVLETNMSSISLKADDKNNSGLNGDIPGSSSILYHPSLSPDLLPYPSPSDFIPPPPSPIPSHSPDFFPPEPIYSPDERLPPLGGRRGPSPPPPVSPDDDFSPPPPVMKYAPNRSHNVEPPIPGGYSRRTPPPSGRHRSQYKSRPPRSSIDSPSSGMSLESLDKSGR